MEEPNPWGVANLGPSYNPRNQKYLHPDHPIIDPDHSGLWIPARYMKAEDLNRLERDLVALVLALCQNELGVCYAGNKYLAEYLSVSQSRLASLLSEVKKKGYIEQISWNGKVRHMKVLK